MEPPAVPPPVGENDRVAVAAPASTVDGALPEKLEFGLSVMQEHFDLDVVELPTTRRSGSYLFEHPEERAADVNSAFEDDSIAALVSLIGGNDQIRILPYLDEEVIASNPTRFLGFSDNTVLCAYLFERGIVSYYAGGLFPEFAAPDLHPYTERYLSRAVFERRLGEIEPADVFSDDVGNWEDPAHLDSTRTFEPHPGRQWAHGDGSVEGVIWGGCLEVIDTLIGADRCIPSLDVFDEIVLALETSEELPSPDYVQRMMLALGERGILEAVSGVMVGAIAARSHRISRPPDERAAYRSAIRETIEKVMSVYAPTVPIVFGVEFGHGAPRVPLPIGGMVELDSDAEVIRCL